MKTTKLTTEHHLLKTFLEKNFVSGKYFTIEEIVEKVRYSDGTPLFKLNTKPTTHDKCVKLGKMVKELNWRIGVERYIPIIKNSKGSIKLCENAQELSDYVAKEKKKLEKQFMYYNRLNSIKFVDGYALFINQANRVLDDEEIKPIEVFKK